MLIRSIFSVLIMGISGLVIVFFLIPKNDREVVVDFLSSEGRFSKIFSNLNSPTEKELSTIKEIEEKKPFAPIETVGRAFSTLISSNNDNRRVMTAESIVNETNKERIKAGLIPFTTNALLSSSAKFKVEDMISREYFEHTSPTGITVSDLGDMVGYQYITMGENLALGNFDSAEDIVKAWMDSPGHRENILNENYLEIGIYIARGKYQGRNVWFAVQHFGTTRNVCPKIDSNIKMAIDAMNTSLKNKETQIIALREVIESGELERSIYLEQVQFFNNIVREYNSELEHSKDVIAIYNTQVDNFNKCLSRYQKVS